MYQVPIYIWKLFVRGGCLEDINIYMHLLTLQMNHKKKIHHHSSEIIIKQNDSNI